MREKNFIEKLKKRAIKNLKVDEVFLNTDLGFDAIKYLKKQNFLEFSKIEIILKNHFISNYPFGYVMKNKNGNIIGFMGTIFSNKIHEDRDNIYCNIHTWIVDNEYRINSFLLLIPLIEKKIILTAFTPVKTLVGLLEKFGFKKIKMKYRIIFLFNFLGFMEKNHFEIERDDYNIKKILNKNDFKIYENYVNLPCEKFTIMNKNDASKYIFVIASKVKKKMFQVLNFFYVSNNEEMRKNWNKIKQKISKEFNLNFCSQYFFDELYCSIPNNILISKSLNKDICVRNLEKHYELDILYSDLIGQI